MGDTSKKNVSAVFTGGKFSCSRLLQVTLSLQVSGIVFPYVFNVQRSDFDPPLPFISHAVGCAPENGMFTFLMISACFLGFMLSLVVNSDMKNAEGSTRLVNVLSFWCCVVYFLSWVLISAFPFTFTDVPNKSEWVWFVLSEHMTGALLMLGCCVLFPIFQAILCCILKTRSNKTVRIKTATLVVPVAIIGIYSLLMLAFEELSVEGLSMKDTTYQLPSKLSIYYITTSICEWILVCSMWFSLFLFHDELKNSKIRICIRKK